MFSDFVRALGARNSKSRLSLVKISQSENSEAELLWVICVQSVMKEDSKYEQLVHQLGLFIDERGIIRSRSRLQKSIVLVLNQVTHVITKKQLLYQVSYINDCHSNSFTLWG